MCDICNLLPNIMVRITLKIQTNVEYWSHSMLHTAVLRNFFSVHCTMPPTGWLSIGNELHRTSVSASFLRNLMWRYIRVCQWNLNVLNHMENSANIMWNTVSYCSDLWNMLKFDKEVRKVKVLKTCSWIFYVYFWPCNNKFYILLKIIC